jgi:hypothetical protein
LCETGPEDHAVGRLGRFGRGVGQRAPVRTQRREAHRDRRERQSEGEHTLGRAQHLERGGRDLRPDTVALHDDDANRRG